MKKTVLTFGLISGGISTVAMLASASVIDTMDHTSSWAEVFGYTTIVLSMLFVFFGVRSYRENLATGGLTFGRAFGVGMLITLVSCSLYVATWEFVQYKFFPDFGAKYAACVVEKTRLSGASAEKVAETERQMAAFQKMYTVPLWNILMTFAEPLPIGIGSTLLSAAFLRKKAPKA